MTRFMKGVFFKKPFEFKVLVHGESWRQGDCISGTLEIRNQGSEAGPLAGVGVFLAYADMKEVAAKADDAFSVLSSAPLDISGGGQLEPQGSCSANWQFQLDLNFAITDKSRSPYLLFGQCDSGSQPGVQLGKLQLTVLPVQQVEEFLQILQIEYRYVVKSTKFNKGWVEVKLAPPSARSFASLEQLILGFRHHAGALEVNYEFKMKKIEVGPASMGVAKSVKEFSQSFTPAEYQLPSGRFNHEKIQAAIETILKQVESEPRW
ncbi:MAG: hypothetical protein A2428_15215 [Bdellovibrionales bacterium RIFOXYC1_FULL_54_43]|nr:MAG: hypothetical protein A2428_15215 [Bdellovibrionales bacterium RIFOXYC1_FULL_54_43]OFZ78422.1 MAG: hypothetical protein A2603_09455 [Bdellovibrionales bacterium RIFOXYD1_FULL_55_31]